MEKWTAAGYDFYDATFADYAVRIRSHYRIDPAAGKARICYLLAQLATDHFQTDREKVLGLARWVCGAAPHVCAVDYRGMGEFYKFHALDLIIRGWCLCEPTSEVFATLAFLAGFPSRTLAIQVDLPQEKVSGHHANEVFLEGKWVFIDSDLLWWFDLEDGTLANAMELRELHFSGKDEVFQRAAERRLEMDFSGSLAFLQTGNMKNYNKPYSQLFENIYVQEGIYSLDTSYGRWIRLLPETKDYLYGPPQDPSVRKCIEDHLPWNYNLRQMHIADHFHHLWEYPYHPYGPMPE